MKDLYFQLVVPFPAHKGMASIEETIKRMADRHYVEFIEGTSDTRPVPYEFDFQMQALPVQNEYGSLAANVSVHCWIPDGNEGSRNGAPENPGQYM